MKMKSKKWYSSVASTQGNVNTIGYKALLNNFKEVVQSVYFQSEVVRLRKKYDIPQKCYRAKNGTCSLPPREWGSKTSRRYKNFCIEINILCSHFNFMENDIGPMFQLYVFFGKIGLLPTYNLCAIQFWVPVDVKKKLALDELFEELSQKTDESDNPYFPISIRINPYASQRAVIDYIKEMYPKVLAPLSEAYRESQISLGKNRTRAHRERDIFIEKFSHLKRKQVQEKVQKKYGQLLSLKYISIIRKRENTRRGNNK